MHLKRIHIENIRSIKDFTWEVQDDMPAAGWHVLIGDNGSGKTTILRAIAAAFVPPTDLGLTLWSPPNNQGPVLLEISDEQSSQHPLDLGYEIHDGVYQFGGNKPFGNINRQQGLFCAAFGPYRRFMGQTYEMSPRLEALLSVFREDYSFFGTIEWLQDLDYRQKSGIPEGNLLDAIKGFINQPEFLPQETQLVEISPKGVFFRDGNHHVAELFELSDGFRSILSLVFEIIRHMQAIYQTNDLFNEDYTQVKMPGVVLIDEVDAHLHPNWQQEIGFTLTRLFPNIQFIVTTHSPLVCQAAIKGSVWKLPTPGTDEVAHRVTGEDLDRLRYGNITEAHSTRLFGLTDTRSDVGREKVKRLAELNRDELYRELSAEEQAEQEELRNALPTSATIMRGQRSQ